MKILRKRVDFLSTISQKLGPFGNHVCENTKARLLIVIIYVHVLFLIYMQASISGN